MDDKYSNSTEGELLKFKQFCSQKNEFFKKVKPLFWQGGRWF